MGGGFSHLYKMQTYKLNKKGVDKINSVLITLLVVGVVLGFTFIFLNTLTEEISDTSATVHNETITPVNGTAVWLDYNYSSVTCFDSFSVTEVMNSTDDQDPIDSGNYSTDPAGTITWNGLDDIEIGETWNVTYGYIWSSSTACVGVEETIEGVAKLPGWLGLVVLMLLIGILITLVYRHIQGRAGGTTAEI